MGDEDVDAMCDALADIAYANGVSPAQLHGIADKALQLQRAAIEEARKIWEKPERGE